MREDTPHNHRRVVEVLEDNLAQLQLSILLEARGVVERYIAKKWGAYKRNIHPRHHAEAVALVVEVLCVRSNHRAYCICSHLSD